METTGKVIENHKTAERQIVTTQPDGPGLRIGKRGELTMIGNVVPGGAERFRERLPQFQAEAGYYETRVGTVQDFRILLFDNDTRFLLSLVYDGDFKPYLNDIATHAGEWLDAMAFDVLEGYPGIGSPEAGPWIISLLIQAEFYFVGAPNSSVKDILKMEKMSNAFNALLDTAG